MTHDSNRSLPCLLPRRRLLGGAASAAACAAVSGAASPFAAAADPATQPAAVVPKIVDSHVHFYDPTRSEGVPWPAKNDAVLYRPVFPEEWEKLVAPLGPAAAIVVEASPWVEDNQWVLDLADRHAASGRDAGRGDAHSGIVGVVGNLPLDDAACAKLIDRFATHRLFRGVRVNGDKLLAGLGDAVFSRHVADLADRGLSVDVNGGDVFAAAVAATDRHPTLRIVVDHVANTRMTPEGPTPEWLDGIARVGERDTVFMKVSGMAESARRSMKAAKAPVDPRFYLPWLEASWKTFGERRLMYGSNWPVSDLAATYAEVFGIVAPFVRSRGPEAERWFYTEASRLAYRWT
jgi:predicted TIM-barrel fold metal-dependent hydrolase